MVLVTMTFFEDLSPCTYFDHPAHRDILTGKPKPAQEWSTHLRAVGWLEWGHDFPRGTSDPDLIQKLASLLESPLEPVFFKGMHFCSLCTQVSGDPSVLYANVAVGNSNVFVPGEGVVYVAPELILHYIADHDYQPPYPFWMAIQACPPANSPEYFRAVRRQGPADFRSLFVGLDD